MMPKVLGTISENPRLSERVPLMQIARQKIETFRERISISKTLNSNHRHILPLKSFSVYEKVWFHRYRYG